MTFIVILHLLICLFLVTVILIQPGKADAGATFGSSSQSIFGSKGAGNFLTKTTSIFAFVFILTSFFLTKDRINAQRGLKVTQESSKVPSQSPAPSVSATASPSPAATPVTGVKTETTMPKQEERTSPAKTKR